jgi:uncharacterized membrane protein
MSEKSTAIILALSLALNVFLVGAAAGGAYMWHAAGPFRGRMVARGGLGVAADTLPVAERKTFRQMLVQARKEAVSDIKDARSGRLKLAQQMVAEPLNRQAIDTQLAAIRQSDMALRARLEKAVVDFAETLTPSERKSFVEGLRGHGAMLRGLKARKN